MDANEPTIYWECVLPCEEHLRLVWQWRNDEDSRRFSFHSAFKSWEDFSKDYRRRYAAFHDLPPLFALYGGARIAFLSFEPINHLNDLKRRCCNLSINVAPEWRGKGLGTVILRQILPWLRERGYDTVSADVRVENSVSAHAFEKAGFKLLEHTWHYISDIDETVAIFRYSVELTPRRLFPEEGVYVIAEAGSNWRLGAPERDLAMAKALIEEAAAAGADAVKFQTYRASGVYVSNAGSANYLAEAGIDKEIYAIYEDLSMPYAMLPLLADYSKQCGIDFMSAAFSEEDFDHVDPHVSVHKIASYEIGHFHLLKKAAASGKPLILSTGAATEDEIDWAVDYFYQQGGRELLLLQCTAAYPAPLDQLNLNAIRWLSERYGTAVGLSDHSRHPWCAPVAAVALGAVVIEKHFTLSNSLPGPDHFFALTPRELDEMVTAVRAAYITLGAPVKKIAPCDEELRSFAKRGVQAIRDIAVGEELREGDNVAILRPGRQKLGMLPRHLLGLSGRRFIRAVPTGYGVQLADLEPAEGS